MHKETKIPHVLLKTIVATRNASENFKENLKGLNWKGELESSVLLEKVKQKETFHDAGLYILNNMHCRRASFPAVMVNSLTLLTANNVHRKQVQQIVISYG